MSFSRRAITFHPRSSHKTYKGVAYSSREHCSERGQLSTQTVRNDEQISPRGRELKKRSLHLQEHGFDPATMYRHFTQ